MNLIRGFSIQCALALLALSLAAAAGCGRRAEAGASAGESHPKVTVAQPLAATVADFSEHTGRTEAPEAVEIRTRASGHLVRAAFREGDLVKKGDLLFVVDPRPYQAALARAQADLQSVRADYELAKKNAARAEELLKTNVIPQRDYDAQSAAVDQLVARRAAAAAAVSSAELDLDYAYVRSPIAGRIGRILITAGNIVGPSTASPLATDRAIGTDQDRRFVWVVGADGRARYHAVKLGPLEDGLRVVREGLSPSDRVVVRGLQRVRPGVEVTPELIAMRAVDSQSSPKETPQ